MKWQDFYEELYIGEGVGNNGSICLNVLAGSTMFSGKFVPKHQCDAEGSFLDDNVLAEGPFATITIRATYVEEREGLKIFFRLSRYPGESFPPGIRVGFYEARFEEGAYCSAKDLPADMFEDGEVPADFLPSKT